MIDSVADLSYSIGYVGLDSVMYSMHFNTTSSCKVKVARVKNKAGEVVHASVESAQSAVRSKLSILVDRSLCPGFGMCVDVQDGDDPDVWPITAVTVPTPLPHPRHILQPLTRVTRGRRSTSSWSRTAASSGAASR